MPKIQHSIVVHASAEQVYWFVSSKTGLLKWWSGDDWIHLQTLNLAPLEHLCLVRAKTAEEADWVFNKGQEWRGTMLRFRLKRRETMTLVDFVHTNCSPLTPQFVAFNTIWGQRMFRLKAEAERAHGKQSRSLAATLLRPSDAVMY